VRIFNTVLLASMLVGPSMAFPHAQATTLRGAGPLSTNLRGFSVTLVEGNLRAGAAAENVPGPAAKALADLKDFLPYKSYRLLDTEWTLGFGPIVGQLRGADGKAYALQVNAQAMPADRDTNSVSISKFQLSEISGSAISSSSQARLETLEMELQRRMASGLAPDHPTVRDMRSQIAELQQKLSEQQGATMAAASIPWQAAMSRPLIDTSFRMTIGETVVVGTSRLQGDTALIVLLTAVANSGR